MIFRSLNRWRIICYYSEEVEAEVLLSRLCFEQLFTFSLFGFIQIMQVSFQEFFINTQLFSSCNRLVLAVLCVSVIMWIDVTKKGDNRLLRTKCGKIDVLKFSVPCQRVRTRPDGGNGYFRCVSKKTWYCTGDAASFLSAGSRSYLMWPAFVWETEVLLISESRIYKVKWMKNESTLFKQDTDTPRWHAIPPLYQVKSSSSPLQRNLILIKTW